MRCRLVFLGTLLIAAQAAASPWQDWGRLRQQAAAFLQQQARASYPEAQATVQVGAVDERLRFPACAAPQFVPQNSRNWGSGNLGVRCDSPEPWTLYLSYQISLRGPALLAKHPLPARTPLAAADWELRETDYAADPGAYPRQLDNFPGAILTRAVAAGAPLQVDMLRRPQAVRSGQRVRIVVEGTGFQVSQEGIAQNSALAGESVKVRLADKRFVQGTAQADGSVRIQP